MSDESLGPYNKKSLDYLQQLIQAYFDLDDWVTAERLNQKYLGLKQYLSNF